MLKLLLLLLLGTTICTQAQTPVPAQPDEVWTQFTVKQKDGEYRKGYKDASGQVRIPAQFTDFPDAIIARKFHHIIAVSEGYLSRGYYLLKSGRKVGVDSLYMVDYAFDCESEGKIRFQDHHKDRVGFFNSQGRVMIPAIYNAASAFHNGLALALIGGRRNCLSGEPDMVDCQTAKWLGGRTVLLNARNEILLDSLPANQLANLNWYSLQINAAAPDTAITTTFRAVNGDRYSFTDYQKEFTRWFYEVFVPAVRSGIPQKVTPLCYHELAVPGNPLQAIPHVEREVFMRKFYRAVLLPNLTTSRYDPAKVLLVPDDSPATTVSSGLAQPFMTDCSRYFQEKYPAFTVSRPHVAPAGKTAHDHDIMLEFVRTAQGYRLLSMFP